MGGIGGGPELAAGETCGTIDSGTRGIILGPMKPEGGGITGCPSGMMVAATERASG
jgi:hypothetical protein